MVKKVSLVGVEFDKTIKEGNQFQSKWSHHPLGLMYLIPSAQKKIPRHSRILNTITCENAGEDAKK